MKTIPEWSVMWGDPPGGLEEVELISPDKWIAVRNGQPAPHKPALVTSAWIKIQLPSGIPKDYGMYIEDIRSQRTKVYIDHHVVWEANYHFPYDTQRSLFPISSEDGEKTVYLKLETSMDRLSIYSDVRLGHYTALMRSFMLKDLQNIIFGCSFLFIAAIMLIGSVFLNRGQFQSWAIISVLSLSVGVIFITYSPFMYANFTQYGGIYSASFDVALFLFLPALTYFIERIFDDGRFTWVRWFRKFQMAYSGLLILLMCVNLLSRNQLLNVYFFASVTVLAVIMVCQFILIIGLCIKLVRKGNKEAVIFSSGFAMLASMGILDLTNYYASSGNYQFFLWKWGVIALFIALVVILVRRFAMNQALMMNYSKELEFYNHQLQLSEKMEIISALAASVAHEVRNPLQVTRGFLQLVASRTDGKNQEYMRVAIEELDRASTIITDFLSFSKPQLEDLADLNVANEIKQIEGIIVPLATLHGGRITVHVPSGLYIRGNVSKFKQVLINLIKNSIEAFQEDGEGQIHIWAYEKQEHIYIHIKDNGEGIEPAKLAKLGEPYFSTKTKGTGLGLMVTFQIVEAMKGTIEFKSQRYIETEVVMCFPRVKEAEAG
ncbi:MULTISPECIES: ATP-binding protein [unclassified Paenibacillus]|uniref:ATP-binding protein n=1 Tax=unclassified Paenibacillus TaxID=185978 RepID=UPI002377D7FE|nr:ATP-binding protein [Paenibacillus sp. MAHUQ-63]